MSRFTYTVYSAGKMPKDHRGFELPPDLVLKCIKGIEMSPDKYTQVRFPGLESNAKILRVSKESGYRGGFLDHQEVYLAIQSSPSPTIVFSAANMADLGRLAGLVSMLFYPEKALDLSGKSA
jgi:hypothetical protein